MGVREPKNLIYSILQKNDGYHIPFLVFLMLTGGFKIAVPQTIQQEQAYVNQLMWMRINYNSTKT
jgi:hypothetical protein